MDLYEDIYCSLKALSESTVSNRVRALAWRLAWLERQLAKAMCQPRR